MTGIREDFALGRGSRARSLLSFTWGALVLLVLPLILYYYSGEIAAWMAGMIQGLEQEDFDKILALLRSVLVVYMLFGLPLLVLRIPIGYYPPGSYSRMIFCLISGVYAIFWVYMFTQGGVLVVDATDLAGAMSSGTITGLTMTADMSGFIWVVMGLMVLKLVIPVAEFKGARDEYINGPQDDRKERVDRTVRVKGRHEGD